MPARRGGRVWQIHLMGTVPTSLAEGEAARIARAVARSEVVSCERFSTGLRHWVYDVETAGGSRLVVRLAHPDHRDELVGGVFWREQLESVGVVVPGLVAVDLEAAQPYMVLERLAGTDLGNVIDELDDEDLAGIASTVADFQARAARLPTAAGYGYALDYRSQLHDTWFEVLDESIDRAARRIEAAGVVDPQYVRMARAGLETAKTSFRDVSPRAFLHDATTKNVIVDRGAVTGIVDTDEMAFGDPLWAASLTRTSLLAAGRSTSYAELLLRQVADADVHRVNLYTAIFALDFLSELGHQFNRDHASVVSDQEIDHLGSILTGALTDP